MTQDKIPSISGEGQRDVGTKHPASEAGAPTSHPPQRPLQGRGLPTHQLNALGERVILPVLLWEALQDLALAFPTP